MTAVPARVIGMTGRIGIPGVGAWGDAVVLDLVDDAVELVDSNRQVRIGKERLVPRTVIKGGRVYTGPEAPILHRHSH